MWGVMADRSIFFGNSENVLVWFINFLVNIKFEDNNAGFSIPLIRTFFSRIQIKQFDFNFLKKKRNQGYGLLLNMNKIYGQLISEKRIITFKTGINSFGRHPDNVHVLEVNFPPGLSPINLASQHLKISRDPRVPVRRRSLLAGQRLNPRVCGEPEKNRDQRPDQSQKRRCNSLRQGHRGLQICQLY